MPITPVQAGVNTDYVDRVPDLCAIIDSKLGDAEWMKDMKYGTVDYPYWQIIVPGSLTWIEKTLLYDLYTKAGWVVYSVLNSEDSDERPGLWCLKLGVAPQKKSG